ncbi:ICE2 family protein [Sporothrix schenckii 1099-18]|uniref:ICE2 family protein n=1 Tax=Sporothrix schenckii 1099-18 TaxID=1397361 RepID=A0A0F2M2A7_SPOSC|nr:ICE2 family protein [Sporothrix schenckii 1099-18]KJR82890.1 ICE2 family protein [Sporothrix schenckii 1099-18]
MLWIFRVLLSTIFLLSVVLSIPIAFDVGGRDAGLAYSLALFLYYSAYSSIKIAVRLVAPSDRASAQRLRWTVAATLRLSQWVVIPSLLIWSLSRFSIDASSTDWVARTVAHVTGGESGASKVVSSVIGASTAGGVGGGGGGGGFGISNFFGLISRGASSSSSSVSSKIRASASASAASASASSSVFTSRPASTSWSDWIFGRGGIVESAALGGWDKSLQYSSPIFQVLEGFCTLLVIQAAGQITRWLVNRGRSDSWLIILVVFSGSVIASAVYFLSRIARFPQIDNIDAILIGVTITSVVFLSAYGIGSGRGNPVESSLLFAYVVLCVYQIFTDYQPSSPEAAERRRQQQQQAAALEPEFPPLPPIIMASYSTLVHLLSTLPTAVSSALHFLHAAFQTITPSVIISLTYRIIVFYCATRIIPAVRESGARALLQEPTLEDSDAASKLLGFLSWYSASILIAIYTSLLLQHFTVASNAAGHDAGWSLLRAGEIAGGTTTRWVNVVGVMVLYAVEMYLGSDDMDGGLTNHWKME